jgi:ABC-type nitrate/sulfonate/bicarbonate transport system substrate-binding protein
MDLKKALQVICLFFVLPAGAAAQEGFKFPVAASSKVLGFAPLWVASGMGFLKREGLDSEVTAIRGTAPTMQALVSDVHLRRAGSQRRCDWACGKRNGHRDDRGWE